MMKCHYCRGQMFIQKELGERPYFKCLQCSRVVSGKDEEPARAELRCEVCQDGPFYNPTALASHRRRCGRSTKEHSGKSAESAGRRHPTPAQVPAK